MVQRINRLASMFLDHIVMTFILVPFFIILMILLQLGLGELYSDFIGSNLRNGYMIFMFVFMIYFLKDSYRGKSIGKRLIGLQVINIETGQPANSFQCFIRNLLIPIWPLEVLISIFSPTRRMGDLIANTKVLTTEKEKVKTIFEDIKQTKFSMHTIFILLVGLLYSYGFSYIFISLLP